MSNIKRIDIKEFREKGFLQAAAVFSRIDRMSRKYLKWVKQQPCCICGAQADDAHHLIGVGGMGGMGMKAPDYTAIPLCRGDHNEIHTNPDLWQDQWEYIVRTLLRAFKEEVISVR